MKKLEKKLYEWAMKSPIRKWALGLEGWKWWFYQIVVGGIGFYIIECLLNLCYSEYFTRIRYYKNIPGYIDNQAHEFDLFVNDYKQWKKHPSELDPSVTARIPIRSNHDTRYFSDKYQALPRHGYTYFFKQLLKHKNITIKLNTNFLKFKKKYDLSNTTIIFTGPIDQYFSDIGYEKLEYRSINFTIYCVITPFTFCNLFTI